MIKNLLRITFVGFIWNRYGTMILSALVLFAYFWIVGKIHGDYLSYAQLHSQTGFVGVSFVVKWLAFLAGVIVYWLFNSVVRKRLIRKGQERELPASRPVTSAQPEALRENAEDDPFEEIRNREALRSKGDLLLEKKRAKNGSQKTR